MPWDLDKIYVQQGYYGYLEIKTKHQSKIWEYIESCQELIKHYNTKNFWKLIEEFNANNK